jgi:hypothetical protein
MTHPPAGPATPTSPPGPGRDIPLTVEQRLENYFAQNGSRRIRRLTPKQFRRLNHKANRAAVRTTD